MRFALQLVFVVSATVASHFHDDLNATLREEGATFAESSDIKTVINVVVQGDFHLYKGG